MLDLVMFVVVAVLGQIQWLTSAERATNPFVRSEQGEREFIYCSLPVGCELGREVAKQIQIEINQISGAVG